MAQISGLLSHNRQFLTTNTGRKVYGRHFRLLVTPFPIAWERLRPRICIIAVGPGDMLFEWLTCLLRGLLMMLDDYMWCYIDSTSLRWHRSSNWIVVACLLMFTLVGMVTLGIPRRGCYILHVVWYAQTTSGILYAKSLLCKCTTLVRIASCTLLVDSNFPLDYGWYAIDFQCLILYCSTIFYTNLDVN